MRYILSNIIILTIVMASFLSLKGQTTFYQDVFYGGVTGGGFSTGQGSGSGTFNIYIEPGSTIKKAWLFAQRYGEASPVNITLNGTEYNFNLSNQVTPNNFLYVTGISAIHAIDVTTNISSSITSYSIIVPIQNNTTIPPNPNIVDANIKYGSFYLWIEYEKVTLPKTNSVILLNQFDLNNPIISYQATNLSPLNTNNSIGFSVYSDRLCDTLVDGSFIYIYNNQLGLIGGPDTVNDSWNCSGVKGHFYYQNDSLFGLDDDTPDSLMGGSDGLADIKSYLSFGDTSFNYLMQWQNSSSNRYNIYIGFFLTYTTPCDTFSTSLSKDTTICIGQTAQLNATGGTKYEWLPQQNLSCYNCPNPTFTGTQTTTYTCRIYNTDSCSKVLPVRIIVQNPKADSLLLTKAFCPNNNGTAQIFADTLLWGKLSFTINGNINNTGNFTNLTPGWHNYTITDTLGCAVTDSLFIPAQVNVTAAFTSNPKTGFAPLTVNFTNLSNSSTINYWLITNQNKDTLLSTNNFQPSTYNFTQSGTYTTTLIACNNIPYCCDTISFTILVEDSAAILLPNVFSPNQDGINDDYQLQLQAAWHFETLQAQIYNRWGEVLQERKFRSTINPIPSNITLWDGFTPAGTPATAGTYFVVVNATLKDGKKISSRIAVSLVR